MSNPDLPCVESVQVFIQGEWYCPGAPTVGMVLQDSIGQLEPITGVAGSVFAVMAMGAGLAFALRIVGEAITPKQSQSPPPPGPGSAGDSIEKGDRF